PESGQHEPQRSFRPACDTQGSLDHCSAVPSLWSTPTCELPSMSEVSSARSPLRSLLKSPATTRVSSHGIEKGAKVAIPFVSTRVRFCAPRKMCTRTEPSPYQ